MSFVNLPSYQLNLEAHESAPLLFPTSLTRRKRRLLSSFMTLVSPFKWTPPPDHGKVYRVSSEIPERLSPTGPAQEPSSKKAPAPGHLTLLLDPGSIPAGEQQLIEIIAATGLAARGTPLSMELLNDDSSWAGLTWDARVSKPGRIVVAIINSGSRVRHPKPVMVVFSPRQPEERFPEVKFDLDQVKI